MNPLENIYTNSETIDNLVEQLVKAIVEQKLVIFIGAGVSIAQGYPNWNNYVQKLINFWNSKILSDNPGIRMTTYEALEAINKSHLSNKRKIDLLNVVIKEIYGEEYNNVRLEFEKNFFGEVKPYSPENEILRWLIDLTPAIYITTNYDSEIEKHLLRVKSSEVVSKINNLTEFFRRQTDLRGNDILHIHGTYKGDSEYFVASSTDYSKTYLREDSYNYKGFKKLKRVIRDMNPVILFIGASMEEDEVLSLLPIIDKANVRRFALMKADKLASPQSMEEYRRLYSTFFKTNYGTELIWYGDSFEDLPLFVKELVNRVKARLQENKATYEWNALNSKQTPTEEYSELFEAFLQANPGVIDDHFEKVIENADILERAMSEAFKEEVVNQVVEQPNFRRLISEKFTHFKEETKERVINLFLKGKLNKYLGEKLIYNLYKNIPSEKQAAIAEVISSALYIIVTDFAKEARLMGKWLVAWLKADEPMLYISDDEKISDVKIYLTKSELSMLKQDATDINHFKSYWPLKDILEDDKWKLVYKLIENKCIYVDETPLLEVLPEELLDIEIIKRILIYYDNCYQNLSISAKERICEKINWEKSYSGSELNEFIEHNRRFLEKKGIIFKDEYIDAISTSRMEIISEKSYIDGEYIINSSVEEIYQRLNSLEDKHLPTDDSLTDRTVEATWKFILEKLKEHDVTSNKLRELLLVKGKDLDVKYLELFKSISIDEEIDSELQIVAKKCYLAKRSKFRFTNGDKEFFSYFIDSKGTDDLDLIDNLLTTNLTQSNEKKEKERLDSFELLNSDKGRFAYCLINLAIGAEKYRERVRQIAIGFVDSRIRDFILGALYQPHEELSYISYNTFLGYCYTHRAVNEEVANLFAGVVSLLLKTEEIVPEIYGCYSALLLNYLVPSEYANEINWSNKYWNNLFRNIIIQDLDYKYIDDWGELITQNVQTILGTFLTCIHEEEASEKRVTKYWSYFKNPDFKYDRINLSRIRYNLERNLTARKRRIVFEILVKIVKENKVKSWNVEYDLEDVVAKLSSSEKKELAKALWASELLTPERREVFIKKKLE